jgi:hypothetical protein
MNNNWTRQLPNTFVLRPQARQVTASSGWIVFQLVLPGLGTFSTIESESIA